MMLVSKIKTKIFRDFLSAIPTGFDEAHIAITPKGLYLKGTDRAHVLMTKIHLNSNAFDTFHIDNKFEIVFDVRHVKNFINVLKSKMVYIGIEDKTKIHMEADDLTYDLQLFNTLNLGKPSVLPDFEFDDVITLSTKNFKSYVVAANMLGIELSMGLKNGGFYIISKTLDDKLVVDIPEDEMAEMDGTHTIDLESSFATSYLISISKAVQFLEYIRLHLKDEYLLKLQGGHAGINVEYFLAPTAVR